MRRHFFFASFGVLFFISSLVAAPPEPPEATPPEIPGDSREGELRTLNDYFPMTPVEAKADWPERREEIRRRTLVAAGLWPMPTKTPLNAKVYGRVERDDYTVEKVTFESMPGHFVSGSLYRPKGHSGKHAAVLCPHGHWKDGRFHDHGYAGVVQQIAEGGERFEVGGRHPLQARCVQLARMGCVVLMYDMIGYADSVQIEHRPGPRKDDQEQWKFFDPEAELHLQTMFGLQTWNSVRALDFITSLDDVDDERIAVTGASGGGTQTMILAAIDDRVDLSFPAVMVSTAMQGGCTCENGNHLRIGQGNIDLAAAFAPKPQGLTAADDWTKELESKGLPELKALYAMLGQPNNITASLATHFKHNYNSVNRTAMYNWVNRHFKLGYGEPVIEKEFVPLSREEASVWDAKHPAPSGGQVGEAHERALLKWWTEDTAAQMSKLSDSDFAKVAGGGWDVLIGRKLEDVGKVEWEQQDKKDAGDHLQISGVLMHADKGEVVPAVFFYPKEWDGTVVLYLTDQGKGPLLDEQGKPNEVVRKLLGEGYAVAGLDLYKQAPPATGSEKPAESQRLVISGNGTQAYQRYAGYTFGYNASMFAQRVHDVLTAVAYVQEHERKPEAIALVASGEQAGPIALAAALQAGDAIKRMEVELHGAKFSNIGRMDDPMFIPGALRYGGVPGLVRLVKMKRGDKATVRE